MLTIDDTRSDEGIGFRHMLEDGLAIVVREEEVELPPKRRRYILTDLADLFDEATKGSEVYEREEYFFDPNESAAVRTCAFIERHLSPRGRPRLKGDLATVSKVLRAMMAYEPVEQSDRKVASQVLKEMLTNVELGGGIGLPEEPENLVWEE